MEKRLLIVYHSQSGTTAALAAAVRRGALCEAGVSVNFMRAWDAGSDDLLACDGLLLGLAENSGTMAGGMKDFLDRTFYPVLPHQLNVPYALFVSAGNDGRGAVAQAQRILSGYPMKAVAEPLVLRGEYNEDAAARCEELGQTLAAGLALGIF